MNAAWAREAPVLAAHRARAQAPLLLAVTATALVALTVLATCGLLLTSGRRDALDVALDGAGVSGTQVVARAVPPPGTPAAETGALVPAVTDAVAGALAPLPADAVTWTESPLLALPADGAPGADPGYAYLTDAPDLTDAARLLDGAWPAPAAGPDAVEVAVPAATAAALGLAPGDTLDLARSPAAPDAAERTTVRVVGVFQPLHRGDPGTPVWRRDLLGGAGVDPEHPRPGTSGRKLSPAYGPLVVAPGSLAAAGTGVGAVTVTLLPAPAGASVAALEQAAGGTDRLRSGLADALDDRAERAVVSTSLPATVRAVATQHAVAGAAVLTAGLVGVALAVAGLLLAGRLLAARRAPERALLLDRGASRRQLLGLAVAEAAAVVLVAAALAVPLGALGYRALTAVPLVAGAGIAPPAGVPAPLVVTVAAGAVALLVALVAPAARPPGGRRRAGTASRVARSGADLLLVAVAVLAVLRLRAGGPADAVRVLAPVLALVASAVVLLRVVPLLGRPAERLARRSRRFVLPLAALDVARRPRAAVALLLLVLAAGSATFGAAWAATWSRSQADQAEALVPAPVVAADVPGAPAEQGVLVRAATSGAALPVTDRATGFGTLPASGPEAAQPRLLAVDTGAATFTGRLPAGTTWAGLTAGLAPAGDDRAAALPFPAGDDVAVQVSGTAGGRHPLSVTPALVLDDGHGVRVGAAGERVPLDGAEHTVPLTVPGGPGDDARVVAVLLRVHVDAVLEQGEGGRSDVAVAVRWGGTSSGADPAGAGGWSVRPTPDTVDAQSVADPAVTAGPGVVRATAEVDVSHASYLPAEVVLTAFAPEDALPVVVTDDLGASAGLAQGDPLQVAVGGTAVPATVAAVAPYLPGATGGPAVLADLRALSRAAIGQGDTTPLVDAWWLPADADVDALRDAGAAVTTRAAVAEELRGGPLRVEVLAALGLLVVSALALALVGAALHAAETAEDRGPEMARLLAVGASPRAVAAAPVVQHVVVDVLAVVSGTAAGALVARALAPALTVSATGGRPVPDATAVWPWPAVGAVALVLLAGSAAVVLPVVTGLVRRASAAHLRLGDAE